MSVKQQVLQQATQLQQRFTQAQERIDEMLPSGQLLELPYLSGDTSILTNLQQRVQAAYLGRQENPIPGATQEELDAISEKLTASADILDLIQANHDIATEIWMVASEFENTFSPANVTNINSETVNSLRDRIVDLTSRPHINAGNLSGLQALQNGLSQMSGPAQQVSAINARGPSVQTPNQSPPPSRSTPSAPVQSSGQIIAEQDEELVPAQYTDKLKNLKDSFKESNPAQDFDKVFTLYKEIKAYSLSKTSYYSRENKEKVENVLQQMEVLMGHIISQQQEIEANQTKQAQSQQNSHSCLRELKEVLEKYCDALRREDPSAFSILSRLNAAYEKLANEFPSEKNKFLEEVYNIQKEQNKFPKDKTVPVGMLRAELKIWPGSTDDKLKALLRIIPSSTPVAPSAPPVVVERKAEEMIRRLDEAKNAVAPSAQTSPGRPTVTTTTSNRPSPAGPLHVENEDSIPENLDTPALRGIKELQTLLSLLQRGESVEDLDELLGKLATLESLGIHLPFKMSGNAPQSIADRPCFHLYFIHKNESPQKLVNDAHYGNNAMAGVYPTSNGERRRAIQRTIVEAALEGLDDAVNLEAPGDIVAMLNIIEEVQLDAIDRPSGSHNIAHTFYDMMYQLHIEARKTNSSLIDPSDRQFNGDFGRNAFRSSVAGIDPEVKINAINAMRNALKAAWKV